MLNALYMENIAVIERAELTPDRGFNVLTGETGAGKSIILDALDAIAGGRCSREIIRTGETRAAVRAVFSELSPEALRLLAEAGVEPEDGQILLSREIYADGRNLCRAGGKPCTLSLLRDLGAELVSIHGQHDGRQLLDPKEHLGYLDAAARTEAELSAYRAAYDRARTVRAKLLKLETEKDERIRRMDLLSFQIAELREADIRPGELDELEARKKKLENAKKIREALEEAGACLSDPREGVGACALLADAGRALVRVAPMSPEAGEAADRAGELSASAEALAETLSRLAEDCRESPGELEETRERIDLVRRLCRKYGGDETAAAAYLENAVREHAALSEDEKGSEALTAEYAEAIGTARTAAAVLTEKRKAAAKRLEKAVEGELAYLEMPRCRFEARFTENGKLSSAGADKMEFYLSPNPGEEPKPLAKIASGGELSRIMLALRSVFRRDASRTLVFDEIDAGVSGRAAQRVGEKLFGVSRDNQVLCVTHLPQIAAMGDAHFSVRKDVENGRTVTQVDRLDRASRARELARITGGFHITDTLLAGGEELLAAADAYKNEEKQREER